MFEKDAEEIANKRCHEIMCYGHCSFSSPKHHRCGEWHREYNCAKDGAEFGYQEGLKAKINATTISDCPIKDKWHKVADGDLPKGNCENILLYNKDHFCVTHSYSLGYYENGVFYNDCEMEEDTIAWREIPLYEEE